MSSQRSVPPSTQAAVFSGGGCLSGFLIPPLAVVIVGLLLAFLSLGSTTTSLPSSLTTLAQIPQIETAAAGLSPVFTPEVQYWAGVIQAWAAEAELDPNLVATVMQIESCGDPRARSRAGAAGLFQVMPFHFYSTDDPYDPEINALRGLAYLKHSLDVANGDVRLALAGYNGGIGVIGRDEFFWAAETQRYAYWGSGIYAEAVSGVGESLRLQEWLEAGGVSLCRQARQRLGIPP